MVRLCTASLAILFVIMCVPSVQAQESSYDFRSRFLTQFENASNKIVALAKEMPDDTYTWSPGEGVMPVARVYMHIARYNYLLPERSLGIPAPKDIDLDTMEEITGKAEVVDHLERSIAFLKQRVEAMTEEELRESTRLYGRTVEGWEVLFQLVTHMSEHVGQSIAYARMNGIVPPWSN